MRRRPARHPQGRRRLRAARSRPIPPSAWPSCSRTPAARSWSPRRACAPACPRRDARVVCLDDADAPEPLAEHRDPPRSQRDADRPRVRHLHLRLDRPSPRASQVPHRALVNFLASHGSARPACAAADVLLARRPPCPSTSPASSSSCRSIVGARVVVAEPRRRRRRRPPAQLLADATASPSCRPRPPPGACSLDSRLARAPGRCSVLCGGEALPPDLAEQLARRGAAALERLRPDRDHHLVHRCSRSLPRPGRPASAGRIANTQLYVLDARGAARAGRRPRRALHRRRGVARGYLGRPELTAERFVPDPFAGDARRAHVPHRRPRPLPPRRRPRVPRPRSTTRSRSAASASSSARSRRCSRGTRMSSEAAVVVAKRPRRRQAARRLRGRPSDRAASPSCATCSGSRCPSTWSRSRSSSSTPAAHARTARSIGARSRIPRGSWMHG